MHPVQKANAEWEAKAIEECRNDPAVAAAGLCYVCMCPHPCRCEDGVTRQRMRKYYEEHRRIDSCGSWFCKTTARDEPAATGSWGTKIDVLMRELHLIAVADCEQVIRDLRKRVSDLEKPNG